MSQGNNFLFIYLQMPSRIRIQPVHLLSQKPCGSSQPVLDVTACSCPGWLLAQGQPQCEDIRTWLFRELEMLHVGAGLALCSPAFFQTPDTGPCQKQALLPLDLWAGPTWSFTFFSCFISL